MRVLRTKRYCQFNFECDFDTVVVDPPRTGLDARTREVIARYRHIIYISCSPEALRRDLGVLCLGERADNTAGTHTSKDLDPGAPAAGASHSVRRMAVFDHFPYTKHVECGVYLRAIDD